MMPTRACCTGRKRMGTLWPEVKELVRLEEGVLVSDDTTLDKPYAQAMELVTRHWSGKHGRVVQGINLITLLWTDPRQGRRVHLKDYGWVQLFKTVGPNGDAEYWATSRLEMPISQAAAYALDAWQIEVYHRGLKQFTGIEASQHRKETPQRNHIGLALRAFLRLEVHRLQSGISWFEAKRSIIRDAVGAYLAQPHFTLPASTA